jgi:hypothetical protein
MSLFDRIDIPRGLGRLPRRTRRRLLPRELDPEQQLEQLGSEVGREGSLSGYVPSPLIPTDRRVAALIIGGAPAWSRRLRRIDTLTDRALEELQASWRALATEHADDPAAFAAAWRAEAESYDFSPVNDLIDRHNRFYPIEANLRISPRTGEYIGPGGGEWRREPLGRAWALAQLPACLDRALAG